MVELNIDDALPGQFNISVHYNSYVEELKEVRASTWQSMALFVTALCFTVGGLAVLTFLFVRCMYRRVQTQRIQHYVETYIDQSLLNNTDAEYVVITEQKVSKASRKPGTLVDMY